MRRCSYCGAEYGDEEAVCAIDHTPLVPARDLAPIQNKYASHILFAICCGTSMTLLSWLLLRISTSPSSIVRNIVSHTMNGPIFLAHSCFPWRSFGFWCWSLTFIQWLALGFGVSFLIHRSRGRKCLP